VKRALAALALVALLGAAFGATAAGQGAAPPADVTQIAVPARPSAPEPPPPLTDAAATRLQRAGGPLPADHALAATFEGTLEVEGHLEQPHLAILYHSIRRIAVAAPQRARLDWTTWRESDTTRWVETTLLDGDRVIRRQGAGNAFVELKGREADDAAAAVWTAAPPLTCARALAHRGAGLTGGPVSGMESDYYWNDALGQCKYMLGPLDDPFALLMSRDEPRLGTINQSFHYFGVTLDAGDAWPDSLRSEGYPKGLIWRLREHRTALEENVPLAELALPDSIVPMPPIVTDTTARVVTIAPHVWAVELRDADTRSLVAEFSDHLVVMETSCDVEHGERLRRTIRDSISTKPVRFVTFSHHHPDYIGGLRAFLADSATVVCAGSNASYVQEIAHYYFRLTRDRLARISPGGVTARVDTLTSGRWRHADAMNELVALDIGEKSHHTRDYLVFWLPRQKLLFEGDLGFFSIGPRVIASGRAVGLLQAIDEAKLAPATVLQGWPVNDNPAGLPMAKFRELVAARAQH